VSETTEIHEPQLIEETENVLWVGETGFEADADKIIVVVDEHRSGFECLTCLAKDIRMVGLNTQVSFVPCKECDGKGKRPKVGNKSIEVKCTECDGAGAVPCPDCGGKGGTLATPDNTKDAPTTGKIVSIGPLVPAGKRKLGDRVMFTSYCGSRYDVKLRLDNGSEKPVQLRILRDEEVVAKLHGRQLELRALKGARSLYTVE
jgi:co-chaperonin GroES (HSP10)